MVKIGSTVPNQQLTQHNTQSKIQEQPKVPKPDLSSSFTTQADPTAMQHNPEAVQTNTEASSSPIKFLTNQALSAMSVPSKAQSTSESPRSDLQPLTIGGSVGRGGQNRPEDIRQVQQALQAVGYLPAGEANGQLDTTLTDAIAKYQQDNGLPVVDGRIDVSKYTMNHLNRRAQGQTSQPSPARQASRVPVHPSLLNLMPQQPNQSTSQEAPQQTMPQHQPTAPMQTAPFQQIAPTAPLSGPQDAQLAQLQQRTVATAQQEWQNGVRESGGRNRGPRVDQYAQNAGMRPGGEWCGYFAGSNYSQNGFRDTPSLASYQKARDYFMYRTYTSGTGSERNQQNDALRTQQTEQGSARQYFMLPESPNRQRVSRNGTWGNQRYGHYNADANTFNFQNLPVRGGDTVLFHRGHVGTVESYNSATGILTTIEGNTSGMGADGRRRSQAVVHKTYDLSDPNVRSQFDGFGRPSLHDFQ